MTPRATPSDQTSMGLPEYLHTVRQLKKLTLREVQDATGNMVSNAYLSQLENGKIAKPSPNILHALAEVYGVEYQILMEKAGYISLSTTTTKHADNRHGRLATLSKMNLTTEEEEQVALYLSFIRQQKKSQPHAKK